MYFVDTPCITDINAWAGANKLQFNDQNGGAQ